MFQYMPPARGATAEPQLVEHGQWFQYMPPARGATYHKEEKQDRER